VGGGGGFNLMMILPKWRSSIIRRCSKIWLQAKYEIRNFKHPWLLAEYENEIF